MTDVSTRLANLKTAVNNFYANGAVQSYTADGVTVTRANIAELNKEIAMLEGSANSRGMAVNHFRRGTA